MAATRLICFRHPQYDGKDSPVLTCKTCCGIFVTAMKAKLSQTEAEKSLKASGNLDNSFESSDPQNEERTVYGFNPSAL